MNGLQQFAGDYADEILIRLMPYGVELCRRHEPVIIGLITWDKLDGADLYNIADQAIAEHGLGLGFEKHPRFAGRRPEPYQKHQGMDWYCGVCHTKLVHQGEHTPACPPMRACRICGCTDDDCSGCIAATGVPCSWVPGEVDLCSACKVQGLPELIAQVDAHEGVGPCVCPVTIDTSADDVMCGRCGGVVPTVATHTEPCVCPVTMNAENGHCTQCGGRERDPAGVVSRIPIPHDTCRCVVPQAAPGGFCASCGRDVPGEVTRLPAPVRVR